MMIVDECLAAQLLPKLDAEANKFTRGTCELVVGDRVYPGAGVIATMAATRMGVGYVKVYTSEEAAPALRVLQPSAVVFGFEQYEVARHVQDSRHPSATVVGCGLCATAENFSLIASVISASVVPLVLDGGALSALATSEGLMALAGHRAAGLPAVITPHAGEAAHLLKEVPEFCEDGCGERPPEGFEPSEHPAAHDAVRLADSYDVVCVLKGPTTYIAAPGDAIDDVRVFAGGSPALAKAGTGDALAGCIGALLAQGMNPVEASMLGVCVHGKAGAMAAEKIGAFGVTTEDVVAMLPQAARLLAL